MAPTVAPAFLWSKIILDSVLERGIDITSFAKNPFSYWLAFTSFGDDFAHTLTNLHGCYWTEKCWQVEYGDYLK